MIIIYLFTSCDILTRSTLADEFEIWSHLSPICWFHLVVKICCGRDRVIKLIFMTFFKDSEIVLNTNTSDERKNGKNTSKFSHLIYCISKVSNNFLIFSYLIFSATHFRSLSVSWSPTILLTIFPFFITANTGTAWTSYSSESSVSSSMSTCQLNQHSLALLHLCTIQ